jgi:hypothetical protein
MELMLDKKIKDLPIIDAHNASKKYSEKEEKWLREPVKCEFINMEDPGLMITFTYGTTKHKHTFKLMHGGKYVVPRFIKNHVESKATPMWKWRADGNGGMKKEQTGSNPRFAMREVFEQ